MNPKKFEQNLLDLLEKIFVFRNIPGKKLKENTNLTNEEILDLLNYTHKKGYVRNDYDGYYLTHLGIDFLMDFRRTRAEERIAYSMLWVTSILAIMAIAGFLSGAIPALVQNPSYRCPENIPYLTNYGADTVQTLTNFGGQATNVKITVNGDNIDGTFYMDDVNLVIPFRETTTLYGKLKIINPDDHSAKFRLVTKFNILRIIPWPIKELSQECFYQKIDNGDFKLVRIP